MEKVWVKNYQNGVPQDINPDAYSSINEIFDNTCEKYIDRKSFVNMGKSITFKELKQLAESFAAFLQNKFNLKKQDRIAIMMPNILQYPIAMFGALKAGLIVVNVNPLYTAKELEFQLNDSGAETIIILENFASTLEKALKNTKIKNVIITKISDMFDFPKSWIIDFVVKYIKRGVPGYNLPNAIKFSDFLKESNNPAYKKVEVRSSDIAYLQYTGGTTGRSKAAMLTHRNIVSNLEQALNWIKPVIKENGQEIIITALPLYHIFSLTANCLTFMRLGALNVLITNPKDIDGFVKELSKYKFSAITGVNTLFNALLHNEKFINLDFSQLKVALGGGMAVQKSVAENWKKVTGKVLLEAYGLTETSPAVCINPMYLKDYNGSIGLPISSTEVSIRDENGNELGFDEPGELWIRGPQVMPGYWNRKEETAEVLTEDGWFKSGDIATINKDGFVKIVDRKKDMILVSGFNVYPNEIEDVISELPGVKEVGVVGVEDESSGEIVKAFIVKKQSELTEEEVINHCRENLTRYKVPKQIEFVDELPKSNVGKILRKELRKVG